MSSQSVTVLCLNGRRTKISIFPSKLLREVLEEACFSQGYDPESHELKHRNRNVDESLSFQLSGLFNNVTLELVASPDKAQVQEVEIALQLSSNGTRQQKKFPSSTKLLELLTEFSSSFKIDLVHPTEPNGVPSLLYINKQWKGPLELEQFTLKSVGIKSGKALLRYSVAILSNGDRVALEEKLAIENEKWTKLKEVYVKQKAENELRAQLYAQREQEVEKRYQQYLEEKAKSTIADQPPQQMETHQEPSSSNSRSIEAGASEEQQSRLQRLQNMLNVVTTSLENNIVDFLPDRLLSDDGRICLNQQTVPQEPTLSPMDFLNFKFPEIPISTYGSMMATERALKSLKTVPKADRNALMFKKSSRIETEGGSEDVSDDFFDLTIDDAKILQRSLKEEVRAQSQHALLTKAFVVQKNKELKEKAYKNSVIRFLINDIIIQAQFYSKEPVKRLYDFITECLMQKNLLFDLVLIPNYRIESSEEKSLLDEGVAPKSTVVIKTNSYGSDLLTMFDVTKFCECSQDDARNATIEWLKVNSEYRQYNPTVQEKPSSAKRTATPMSVDVDEPDVYRKALKSNPKAPKWFKK